jgi:hypothetical protein
MGLGREIVPMESFKSKEKKFGRIENSHKRMSLSYVIGEIRQS